MSMFYLSFKGEDKFPTLDFYGKLYAIKNLEAWDDAVEDITKQVEAEGLSMDDLSLMCSSSIDFPEEYTDDKDLIWLCYRIRGYDGED